VGNREREWRTTTTTTNMENGEGEENTAVGWGDTSITKRRLIGGKRQGLWDRTDISEQRHDTGWFARYVL